MNKKLVVLTFVFLLVLLAIWWLPGVFRSKVGDIGPALLPTIKQQGKTNETVTPSRDKVGEQLDFSLSTPSGFRAGIFAKNVDGARDLDVSPGGTILLSLPSKGRVVALPDRNSDGVADEVKEIVTGLDRPHGIAFYQDKLFIAEETQVVRYNWHEDNLTATREKTLFTLPRGGNHRSRTIAFDKDGKMFVTLGSTCDTCFEDHEWLASVVVSDHEGRNPRLFARGLRNSVFIVVNKETNELWGTEMGRDFLGDNLPPDEINIIKDGKDYGWPVCYGNRVYDTKFGQRSPSYCVQTEPSIYEIAAHSAPLGLIFIDSSQFAPDWQGDVLVSYHGSWNRSSPIGYKVVRLQRDGNTIKAEEDFLSGFLQGGQALGRPVDLVFDKDGYLFVSDDKAGVVYIVGKSND